MNNVNCFAYQFVNDDGNACYTRRRIYDFIFERRTTGVKPNEVWKSEMWEALGRTRQWGHKCLNVLEKQNLIFEHNHKYYPVNSDLTNIYWFASEMEYYSGTLTSFRKYDDANHPSPYFYTTPLGILESKTRGSSPSPNFCKTNFNSQHSTEEDIFEFANRIGAYVTYIFIQSMKLRPSVNQTENNQKERNEKADILIHNAINLKHWYEHFCELFIDTVVTGREELTLVKDRLYQREQEETKKIIQYLELDQKQFNKFSRAFQNVYPGIYGGLEASWCKVVEDSITTEQYFANRIKRECKHRVEETKIYKYPRRCYWCKNCQGFSHDKSFREPKSDNLPLELRSIISKNIDSYGFNNRVVERTILEE